MIISNKRGFSFLGESVMKIIIAAICLAILFGLLGKLYFSNLENKELNQAKDTINRLEQEINDIDSGQTREFTIYSPSNSLDDTFNKWTLLFFDSNTPEQCSEECICICKGDNLESCNKIGSCFESEFRLNKKILLDDAPISLLINSDNKEISLE
ncbi:MAG: hypothetical protein ACOC3V_03620 [bacterium]